MKKILDTMTLDLDTLPTSQCHLCPRECGARRIAGEQGVCGASNTLVVARAALHEWEEPPISVGPGSGTVFFAHCPLRCVYCQNVAIAHGGVGKEITVDRLARIFIELQNQGAANINLVTPTHYLYEIHQALLQARDLGLVLPVVYNTSGYERSECIEAIAPDIDIWLTDFKYWISKESNAAQRYSHAPNYFDAALEALDAMVIAAPEIQFDTWEGQQRLSRGVVLRHLLLPGRLDDSKRLLGFLWSRYGDQVLYSIMNQYTPVSLFPNMPELEQQVPKSAYETLLDYCDSIGLTSYYWQEGSAAQESFIPPFDLTGV